MSKFKVGDKVVTHKWGKGDGSQVADGLVGTVTEKDGAVYPYGIVLDDGHYELTGDVPPLWCFEDEIEPLDG